MSNESPPFFPHFKKIGEERPSLASAKNSTREWKEETGGIVPFQLVSCKLLNKLN
jgi:hypothetical protein